MQSLLTKEESWHKVLKSALFGDSRARVFIGSTITHVKSCADFEPTQPSFNSESTIMNSLSSGNLASTFASTTQPVLHVADVTIDDVPPMPAGLEPKVGLLNRKPASKFAVDRGEGLEPVHLEDIELVRAQIKNQVVLGGKPIVYIYELVGAEVLVPTSVSITVEEIEARLKSASNGD